MAPPLPAVQVQGQGAVNADNLNTYVQTVANYAQLRSFVGLNNMAVFVLGAISSDDGGQGLFYYNSTSTSADNNSSIIVPTGNIQGAWIRETEAAQGPTYTVLSTPGTGAYTPPVGAVWLRIRAVGGGGGGTGGGTTQPAGNYGVASLFSTISAGGGASVSGGFGGNQGGTPAGGTLNISGGWSGSGIQSTTSTSTPGGQGGGSYFGSGGAGGYGSAGAPAAPTTPGAGGGAGGSGTVSGVSGSGGGGGAYCELIISPIPANAGYAYTVGAGGTGGAAGSGGSAGGAGAPGMIIVEEYYS